MSILENNLSRHSKELSVFGYIRQYSIHEVPVAIIKLCLNYFDELFYISISGNVLKQFLAMKHGERIEKKVKYNKELLFKYRVYPNGYQKGPKGDTLLFLKLSAINKSQISEIYFNFEINCNHTNTKYIGGGYRTPDSSNLYGWENGFMRLLEYKNDKTLNNLIFSIFIDIIYIKYTNNITWIKPYKVNEKTTLIFKLDEKLKKTMKNWPVGKSIVCDVSNDMCWVMSFAPTGFDETDKEKPCVQYNFLKWSHKIKKMHFVLKTNGKMDNETFKIDQTDSSMVFAMSNDIFGTNKEMELKAEITIVQISDCNDNLELFVGRKHIEFGHK